MLAANCPAGSDADNTKDDAKATFNSAKDTVKDVVQQSKDAVQAGTQEAHEVATNVVYAIKAGAKKAGEVATNLAAKVRAAVTNATTEIKAKVKDVSRKDRDTNPPDGNVRKTNPDAI